MGKVEDQRAMREAKYEARNKTQGKPKTVKMEPAPDTSWVETVEIKDYDKCGHKGVSGKSCTRPRDHEEQNHRYK